ncbi:M15 family metallopeptidase [Serratia sp. UGAL515B_01]|uniref:M15 family metallopeptidase n=1 Tax=Serratia sp. UGAL515B_01 TaxID=2986763 RepID=UPI002955048A|nr:M15 family metallopeptidase [Serratia sp. UGAL515B_01]WON77567.1 M15 family metallopeptidase [Serratia sp. UGAL515B_01]
MFRFSKRSEENLKGVNPALVKVVRRAIELTTVDFMVIEGLRTQERQRQLVRNGTSQTLSSRHLTGHAVDCAPLVKGSIPWNDKSKFKAVSDAMFTAAKELGVKIRWGGDWNENGRSDDEKFYDGPHFELRRQDYP